MIGLLISLCIQMVVLTIRLLILVVGLTFRFIMWLIAAIARAISDRRSRRTGGVVPGLGYVRVPLDPDVRWAIYRRDGYACVTCGSPSDLTIDHILAVSRGGSNDLDNLRTLCRSCNSSKGARVVATF